MNIPTVSRRNPAKNPAVQRMRSITVCLGVVWFLVAGLTSCAHLGPPAADATPTATTATVLRVVDGDTIDVRDDTRGRIRIRLLGIDSPETKKPGYTIGCGGPEATAFATETLAGQRVAVTSDPTQDTHDRYGRTLAYIVLADGRDFAVEAARAGAVRTYVYDNKPVSHYPQIKAAEDEARAAHRGLWGPPCNGHTESTPA